jgi:hypothetical protein
VDRTLIIGFVALAIGLLQTVWTIWAIKTDAPATYLSLIEAAILKVTKTEPLPKSRVGLAFDRFMLWIGLILGLVFISIGVLFLVTR